MAGRSSVGHVERRIAVVVVAVLLVLGVLYVGYAYLWVYDIGFSTAGDTHWSNAALVAALSLGFATATVAAAIGGHRVWQNEHPSAASWTALVAGGAVGLACAIPIPFLALVTMS